MVGAFIYIYTYMLNVGFRRSVFHIYIYIYIHTSDSDVLYLNTTIGV